MSVKEFTFNTVIAVVSTVASAWLGGWDMALQTLFMFMIFDYATGFLGAIKNKNLNSEVMFWGGIRKAAILIVIAIAVQFDNLVGDGTPIFRTLATYFYVAREGLSLIHI